MPKMPNILLTSERPRAVEVLRRYFGLDGSPPFTGSRFERLGGGGDAEATANVVTAEDIVALSMLSIRMHGTAARRLLEDEEFKAAVSACLAEIPTDLHLADADPEVIAPGSPASELWRLFRSLYRVGQTTTSKLIARKRPKLIPVYDSVIQGAFDLNDSGGQWDYWLEMFTADGKKLHHDMLDLRAEAGVPDHVSPLRVLDVVVWMEHRRPAEDDDEAVPVTD